MKKNYIAPDMTVVMMQSNSTLLAGSTLSVDYNTTLDNGDALAPEMGEGLVSFGEDFDIFGE